MTLPNSVEWFVEKVDKLRIDAAERCNDPEEMHEREDAIHRQALTLIREGHNQPTEIAAVALRTRDIEFPRWYA